MSESEIRSQNPSYSSRNFWMYRCCNGQTYALGKNGREFPKIHPGSVVRCELDLEASTLSYAIDGVDYGVVFTGVSGMVRPAVCFYGTSHAVKLLKVERLGVSDGIESKDYPKNDPLHRRIWYGKFVKGRRHGEGKLFYSQSYQKQYWYGNWIDDFREGLCAWVDPCSQGDNRNTSMGAAKTEAEAAAVSPLPPMVIKTSKSRAASTFNVQSTSKRGPSVSQANKVVSTNDYSIKIYLFRSDVMIREATNEDLDRLVSQM